MTLISTPTTRSLALLSVGLTVSLHPICLLGAEGDEIAFERIARVEMTNGNPSGLTKYGDHLYMVMNESVTPLLVFDISEPGKPRLVNRVRAPGWPMRCRIVADKWLWTVHRNGEGFFDLTDPANPVIAKEPGKGPNLRRVSRERFTRRFLTYISCSYDDVLYYGCHGEVSADTERAPEKVGGNEEEAQEAEDTDDPVESAVEGRDEKPEEDQKQEDADPAPEVWRKVEVHDIRDPNRPALLSTIDGVIPRTLQGDLLFATGKGIFIYDVKDPKEPKLLCHLDNKPEWKDFQLRGSECYAYADGRLYMGIIRDCPDFFGHGRIARSQVGVAVFDARGWKNAKLLGYGFSSDQIAGIGSLVYHKGFVFSNDSGFGLRVFDVRDPRNVHEVPGHREGGELSAALLIPQRRLLALGQNINGNVFLVDVEDPQNPRTLGYFHHRLRVWGRMATFEDRYLYFQADKSRPWGAAVFYALDIQDPERPKLTHAIPKVGRIYNLTVVDRHLYAGSGRIFDLADPARPRPLPARIPGAAKYGDLLYREPFLFVVNPYGEKHGSLSVVDISRRDKPVLVGRTVLPGKGHRVTTTALMGKYLFVGWGWVAYAVDVSNPRQPEVVRKWHVATHLGLPRHYCHVWSDGDTLFIGSYRRHIGAYDVSGIPEKPRRLGLLDWAPSAWFMTGEQGIIYRVCLNRLQVVRYGKNPPGEEN